MRRTLPTDAEAREILSRRRTRPLPRPAPKAGRALQASVLKIWSADKSKAAEAQQMAVALAAANAAASLGRYEGPHPSALKGDSLREVFRGWRSDEAKRS